VKLTVLTDFGEYEVPESIRVRVWDKLRDDGMPDRRYKIAPVLDRYFRAVDSAQRRRFAS